MLAQLREHFHPYELRYPANWLSLLRLVLIPIAGRHMRQPDGRNKALAISALAMSTDMVDGYIARRRNEVSNLGKILDPIADKLFVNSIASALAARGELPRWVVRLLVARDVAIVAGSILLFRRRSHLAASAWLGKLTTTGLMSAILLYMINAPRLGRVLLNLSLGPLIASILQYGLRFIRIMRDEGEEERGGGS